MEELCSKETVDLLVVPGLLKQSDLFHFISSLLFLLVYSFAGLLAYYAFSSRIVTRVKIGKQTSLTNEIKNM